jgi:ABC-2 type transport system ATP-binding protein
LVLRSLDGAGIPVASATLRQPTLDDVFLALTGRSLRDAEPADPAGAPDGPDGTPPQVPAGTPTGTPTTS